MSAFKEFFILVLILASAFIISLTASDKPSNQTNIKKNISSADLSENQNAPKSLFKQIWGLNQCSSETNESADIEIKPTNENLSVIIEEQDQIVIQKDKISLEDILAEVENLSADLKTKLEKMEQDRNCPNCEQEDEDLKNYLLSIGYSSWEEYSLSKQYQSAKEYFLTNQESLLSQSLSDTSPSCQSILGSLSAVCGCNDPSCYVDTAYGRVYYCAGPCCCVCCVICCR